MSIRLNNVGKLACDRLTEDADFGKKKSSFQMKLLLSRIWSTENPHAYIEKPMHPKRNTVLCGFWFRGIIESFFFENEQVEAVTVNGDFYRAILKEFSFTKIKEKDIGNIWFQQYGATCHTAEATLDVFRPVFEDRIISRRRSYLGAPI